MPEYLVYLILFLAPLLSGIVLWLAKPEKTKYLGILLSFSGAFLLTICIVHLLPELYKSHDNSVGVFILLGFLLQLVLEYFSKGIEHGHIHTEKNNFIHFPIAIYLSLCVHSLVEGMALTNPSTGVATHIFSSYQNALLIGIIIHKIPITLVLITLFIAAKIKKSVQVISLVIFCLCAPLGLYFANLYEQSTSNPAFGFNIFLALSIGVFLHISTTILFESSKNHKFNFVNFATLILGAAVAYLSTTFLF